MLPILIKTEEACAQVAVDAIEGASLNNLDNVTVYTGLGNDDKEAPAVICYAESAREDFPFSGIYHVVTHITVKEMAVEMNKNDWGEISDVVFQAFINGNIEQNLNESVDRYSVYQVMVEDTQTETSADAWAQQITLDIVCALKQS